jgi:hypothetical protein
MSSAFRFRRLSPGIAPHAKIHLTGPLPPVD